MAIESGEPEPGEVWLADGAALSFEWRFKWRPVLIVESDDGDGFGVVPLSSRAHLPWPSRGGGFFDIPIGYGEPGRERVSFLAAIELATISRDALRKRLGRWDGFDDWLAGILRDAAEIERARARVRRAADAVGEILKRFFSRFGFRR